MNNIEQRITFYYAEIDMDTGECIGVCALSYTTSRPEYVEILVYTEDYIEKYYNFDNGKWYLDGTFTTEWSPV